MSNIIVKRFLLDFNWPFGSALAIVLLVTMILLLTIVRKRIIVLLVTMILFLTIVSKYVALEDIYGTGR